MTTARKFNLARFEVVDGAYDALIRMGDFMTCDDPRAWVRQSTILLDACIDAGMPMDESDHTLWAAEYIVAALTAA